MNVPATVLKGLPYELAKCFGMPTFGCHYTGKDYRRYERDEGARCIICGQNADNCHHIPSRGLGGGRGAFTLGTPKGSFELLPAIVAVCGSGTTGCHGRIHDRSIKVTWEWDSEEAEQAWWDGDLLAAGYKSNDQRLYNFGRWVIIAEKYLLNY